MNCNVFDSESINNCNDCDSKNNINYCGSCNNHCSCMITEDRADNLYKNMTHTELEKGK
jgi:hypothetical protein